MSATQRTIPNGGYDHIGVNWISSYTPGQNLVIRTAAAGGEDYAAFNPTDKSLQVDKLDELTPDAGISAQGLLIKDETIKAGTGILKIGSHAGNDVYIEDDAGVLYAILGRSGGNGMIMPFNRKTYSASGYSASRSISDTGTITLTQLANVVATMIADIKSHGFFA